MVFSAAVRDTSGLFRGFAFEVWVASGRGFLVVYLVLLCEIRLVSVRVALRYGWPLRGISFLIDLCCPARYEWSAGVSVVFLIVVLCNSLCVFFRKVAMVNPR